MTVKVTFVRDYYSSVVVTTVLWEVTTVLSVVITVLWEVITVLVSCC